MERIRLGNTVFEGRNNAYLIPGDRPTLVDVGVATDSVRHDVRDGLQAAGYEVSDLEAIVLTHWHADHTGLAGELQAESGASVYVHADDAGIVAGDPEALAEERDIRDRRFSEWGIPDGPLDEVTSFLDGHDELQGDRVDVTPVEDGDRIAAGDDELEVVHFPGHAAGLSAFAFDGDDGREAFVGDVILPKYTPNVGGADLRVDRPLETYLDSLARLADQNFARAWPGHRDPIDDPAERARVIAEHHRERTRRVLSVLDEHGPADAWTVSAHLFGDLSNIHILHGPGEAFAHLDHLVAEGVIERDGTEYVAAAGDVAVDELVPVPETKR
ncbi:MBL fold metallo-hydrolase [Haloferax mediterranei ATCC 33500]|uniref:MBL fold metallo-hydrolase n=1 Tax=Haloferax mediterranei (strain ATCC 33500 / DSM 1411 / JCM 8866 / NBRC 14739 / NCIMB 2177 / R-4) TaxID=523841 RepID=I3R3E5_HALMT|nr:MBL fold metallo-hydrolase [Haloferax mediterranei]AFK18755.1 metallo-beta-lactamase family protein / hydrolase [Haloferax mediterranei ATCC 33500]AHZ21877.1 metallo-beta-lactamase [Haloferax mediterranei ATCC 33500]EMA03385.1 metallo-beta-lactamase family protein / hydrolase [Haloferax mediterranei ATCC 33500]MDX5988851.1 MBL fold metallo-hydrolase [Haloferax mediterranei ATCC 33500]QCQ75250.1 MBL fold metallo-hydrolase [Haloferax mediterranei ATCC 33500]